MTYDFSKRAEKELLKLSPDTQVRIIKKIESCLKKPDPLKDAKKLSGTRRSYRFAFGDYRVIFDWEDDKIFILRVGHRREIYR
ncbi:MAG: type II toxin-antitoxin system RelE/ParE family toxin [Chlamydiae bacterium]|nr:type II toxin-antitoxin system RelE/ParE family toxin [Chlamydiota bacterium]MBI3278100.1 type II toxin-antitoxin system RelE/ParE family toxin [Chlamydiota bacterium]